MTTDRARRRERDQLVRRFYVHLLGAQRAAEMLYLDDVASSLRQMRKTAWTRWLALAATARGDATDE